jgi:hypothetical protein
MPSKGFRGRRGLPTSKHPPACCYFTLTKRHSARERHGFSPPAFLPYRMKLVGEVVVVVQWVCVRQECSDEGCRRKSKKSKTVARSYKTSVGSASCSSSPHELRRRLPTGPLSDQATLLGTITLANYLRAERSNGAVAKSMQ